MSTWPLFWKIVFWIGVGFVGFMLVFGLMWAIKVINFTPEKSAEAVEEKIVYVEVTSTPVAPAAEIPAIPPVAATNVESCHVIHESVVVETMDHAATSGSFIHLEYWWDGQPEKETILPAAEAGGGRFNFIRPLKGWIWEYQNCTFEEVKAQVDVHIPRRIEGGANNAGYFNWKETGLFVPVPLPQ